MSHPPTRFTRRRFLAMTAALPVAQAMFSSTPAVHAAETPLSPIAVPDVTAKAVYVYDDTAGIPLYSKEPDAHLAVGSIVKLMTALTVIKHVPDLDNTIFTAAKEDEVEPPYTEMGLVAGDELPVSLLLWGLLIPSGNDAARCLARSVGTQLAGTENARLAMQAFMDEMNRYARELGLDNSRFITPDGTDAEAAYSSAEDVCLLMRLSMKQELLRNIMKEPATRFYTTNAPDAGKPREYNLANTNKFINGEITPNPGIIGGKTGTEVSAGANIVLARMVGNNLVIITIIGADHSFGTEGTGEGAYDKRYDDAQALISAMDAGFTWSAPDADGVLPGLKDEMTVWNVQLREPPAIPIPTAPDAPMGYQLQIAPPDNAGVAGKVYLYYGSTQVGSLPIYTTGA